MSEAEKSPPSEPAESSDKDDPYRNLSMGPYFASEARRLGRVMWASGDLGMTNEYFAHLKANFPREEQRLVLEQMANDEEAVEGPRPTRSKAMIEAWRDAYLPVAPALGANGGSLKDEALGEYIRICGDSLAADTVDGAIALAEDPHFVATYADYSMMRAYTQRRGLSDTLVEARLGGDVPDPWVSLNLMHHSLARGVALPLVEQIVERQPKLWDALEPRDSKSESTAFLRMLADGIVDPLSPPRPRDEHSAEEAPSAPLEPDDALERLKWYFDHNPHLKDISKEAETTALTRFTPAMLAFVHQRTPVALERFQACSVSMALRAPYNWVWSVEQGMNPIEAVGGMLGNKQELTCWTDKKGVHHNPYAALPKFPRSKGTPDAGLTTLGFRLPEESKMLRSAAQSEALEYFIESGVHPNLTDVAWMLRTTDESPQLRKNFVVILKDWMKQPTDVADDFLGEMVPLTKGSMSDSHLVADRLKTMRQAGFTFTPIDSQAFERRLGEISRPRWNIPALTEIYRMTPDAEHALPTIHGVAEVHREIAVGKSWDQRVGMSPPLGLNGHSCYGVKPATLAWAMQKTAQEAQQNGGYSLNLSTQAAMNVHGYKLAVAFGSPDRIERYVTKHIREKDSTNTQPYHDAAQFDLPQEPGWPIPTWGDTLLRHGPKMARFIRFAEKGLPPPVSVSKAVEKYAGMVYRQGAEDPELAEICLSLNLDEDDFTAALAARKGVNAQMASSNIPNLSITGDRFGLPGYTWRRANPGDARILVAGEMVNCCQHVNGVGNEAAIHSATSPDGACFFLEKDGETKRSTASVVAISWAWRGQRDELCFDSFEAVGPGYRQHFPALMEATRDELHRSHPSVTTVTVGAGGGTPKVAWPRMEADDKETPVPRAFEGYRDSHQQFLLLAASKKKDLKTAQASLDGIKSGVVLQ
jgi:hypothetical protein